MTTWTLDLLGPIELRRDAIAVALPGGKPRCLLAALGLSVNRVQPTPKLIEGIWGDVPPATVTNALHVHVSALRRSLANSSQEGAPLPIFTQPGGYVLRLPENAVDIQRFESLSSYSQQQMRLQDWAGALKSLDSGLELWRGPVLVDFRLLNFAQPHIGRLEALQLTAKANRIEALHQLGESSQVASEVRMLVCEHPFDERLIALLMRVLYVSGQQSEALQIYAHSRRQFVDELGLELGPDIRLLHEKILRQDPDLQPKLKSAIEGAGRRIPEPGTRRLATAPLPKSLTSLVGRQLETQQVMRLLLDDKNRLISLVGTGGSGKTRLALQVAERAAPYFADGVAFVNLSVVSQGIDIWPEIFRNLGLPEAPGADAGETLCQILSGKRLLLILDNFEQLIESSDVILTILRKTIKVKIVVTSRVPLNLSLERVFDVSALTRPNCNNYQTATPHEVLQSYESVRLFVERAQSVSDFTLTSINYVAVAEICRHLDGVPLAIELAAARTRMMLPETILERLTESLKILTDGPKDLPERQRSLRAVLDWSFALLSKSEATVLAQLSVFAGSFSIEAAENVIDFGAGEVLETLAGLLDKHLLKVDSQGRFSMLFVVSEYAREVFIADARMVAKVTERFLHWVLAFAEDCRNEMLEVGLQVRKSTQIEFDSEVANIVAALRLIEGAENGDQLADLLSTVGVLFHRSGRIAQISHWLRAALQYELADERRARLLHAWGGYLLVAEADLPRAESALRDAIALYAEHSETATIWAGHTLANSLRWQGRHHEALELRRTLVCQAKLIEFSDESIGNLECEVGELLDELDDPVGAERAVVEMLEIAKAKQNSEDIAYGLANLALLKCTNCDGASDEGYLERGLALVPELKDSSSARADLLHMFGIASLGLRRFEASLRVLLEANASMLETGYLLPFADNVSAIGIAYALKRDSLPHIAAFFFGAGDAIRARTGARMTYRELRLAYTEARAIIDDRLEPAELDLARRRGAVASQYAHTLVSSIAEEASM